MDALGSTLDLTNQAGAVQASYHYEAFGKTVVTGTSSNPFQYTGRENDNTSLYSYRARYYNPTSERFVSEDPTHSPLLRAAKCQKSYSPSVYNYVEADAALASLMAIGFYDAAEAFALNPLEMHLYTYVNNNPVNRFDPSGLRTRNPRIPGCDRVKRTGGVFTSKCGINCCDIHDECYDAASSLCSEASWFGLVNPLWFAADLECQACNIEVLKCLQGCKRIDKKK